MAAMFQSTKLTSLDLSKFKTKNVYDISCMFNSCRDLKYLNLNKFDYSNVKNYNNMFDGLENSLFYLNIFSVMIDLIISIMIYCLKFQMKIL